MMGRINYIFQDNRLQRAFVMVDEIENLLKVNTSFKHPPVINGLPHYIEYINNVSQVLERILFSHC